MSTETLVAGADTTQPAAAPAAAPAPAPTPSAAPAAAPVPAAAPAAAAPAPAPVASTSEESYEFTAPDGVELDKGSLDEFTAIAKELKLPKDAAQKVVDLAVKRETERAAAHQTLVSGWADQVKADKDIGGDKLPETLATARKAIELGGPELKDLLNSTGMGNHPAVVRWAFNVGKALSEDRFVTGAAPAQAGSVADRMYPSSAPKAAT